MSQSLRLAMAIVLLGGIIGLMVLAAAAVAGRQRKVPYWLAGTGWGMVVTGLSLADCLIGSGRGPSFISDMAVPLFFGGVLVWPVALSWKHPRWALRWLAAQGVMLLTVAPAFIAAVGGALCSFT